MDTVFQKAMLYAITPEFSDRQHLLQAVEAVLQGGCRLIQYRDKSSDMAEKLARAHALRALTTRFGATLIVNDSLLIAVQVDADGLHCGKDDGSLLLARRVLGDKKILGASCYGSVESARRALDNGADYVAFGAAFPSTGKPDAPVLPADFFFDVKKHLSAKICAIGGITPERALILQKAGVDYLAVMSDLFQANNLIKRAAEYAKLSKP